MNASHALSRAGSEARHSTSTPGADVHLLAISGSLRAGSSNTALLTAAARLAPPRVTVELYPSVAVLPHFDPDLDAPDGGRLPDQVTALRGLVGRADGLLLSAPEYAHGLPGAFKNALDWLVGSVEFPGKAVAVLSPTARSVHAQAQLREVLRTMSARIVESASVVVPLASRVMDEDGLLADQELAALLRTALVAIADDIRSMRHSDVRAPSA
jgi:NAD(P)H-dependent FMN reductase